MVLQDQFTKNFRCCTAVAHVHLHVVHLTCALDSHGKLGMATDHSTLRIPAGLTVNHLVLRRHGNEPRRQRSTHCYRIALCSRSFIPVTFGPGTKGGFCPGSKGEPGQRGGQGPFVPGGATNPDKRPPFCPGWWLHPGQKVQPLLSRLVTPTRTKG